MVKTLTLDLSTRDFGWACDREGYNRPAYGLIKMPGMSDLGALYAAARNSVTDLIEKYNPEQVVFCMALFRDAQTAAEALAGVQATSILVAYDHGIASLRAIEMRARKAVLGRGSFGQINPATGSIIKGSGSKEAKSAVMRWADERGYIDGCESWFTHDCGDALVLLEYVHLLEQGYIDDTGKRRAKPKGKRQIERLRGGG